ncbi:IclR family transcriptional regulator domain-containing protein [Rhizobium rhizogenes]|uniref:Regulatory protein, IclR family n=1 Tax=Rhizobium rhizogenes (strain K84 / ATCC BAA-868) TaxID=311403 RepID=B9JPW1_RHIR8|nr:regulatory protein, IclR family [Rhizobium rhizogenes K84]
MMTEDESTFVRSIARGLKVIEAMSAVQDGLSLSEVAMRVDLDRATARRILLTLQSLGYVRQAEKRFSLSPKVLGLGYAYLSGTPLWSVSAPYLMTAATAISGSCSIAVLQGSEAIYVARQTSGKRSLAQSVEIGTRFPLYCTSAGKVLLTRFSDDEFQEYTATTELNAFTTRTITSAPKLRTEVEHVRKQGWAISDQEYEDGVRSVAVPILDATGKTVAAMVASSQASRLVDDDWRAIADDHRRILIDALEPLAPLWWAQTPVR